MIGRRAATLGALAIALPARAQAQAFGASVALRNHPDGGLLATIRLNANSWVDPTSTRTGDSVRALSR